MSEKLNINFASWHGMATSLVIQTPVLNGLHCTQCSSSATLMFPDGLAEAYCVDIDTAIKLRLDRGMPDA